MHYKDLPKDKQIQLDKILTEDILFHYDHPQYHDKQIIEDFIHDYEVEEEKDIKRIFN